MGLHQRYARLLQGTPLTLAATDGKHLMREHLTRLFRGMMQALFRQQGASLDISILTSDEAQQFINGHAAVLDSSFAQVPMSETMRRRLTRSTYVFSGMKTFHELNEAFPSLLDEDGNRKPFERFLNDVRRIDETYNRHYLRAEYNFVHASAQAAARWEQFMQDGDRYHLQYRTAADSRVRPEHADLHGVTLPPSDPFWEEFYPPNGWNCRCTVVQVRKGKHPATDPDEAHARGEAALQLDKKGMFRFNPGRQQKAVPDYNPYTISQCRQCDVPDGTSLEMARRTPPANELCAACRLIRKQQQRDTARDIYRRLKADPDYTDVQFDEQTGGVKATHRGHSFEETVGKYGIPRGEYEKITADALYKKGYVVELIKEDDHTQGVPQPDGYINGSLMDIKGIEGNPLYALNRANKQRVETAVLYFHDANAFSQEQVAAKYAQLGSWLEYTRGKKIPVCIKKVICIVNKGKEGFDLIEIKNPEE